MEVMDDIKMPESLKEIWIFSKDGVPITDFRTDGVLNKSILGGLVSAIKTFSKKGIVSFEMGENKFTCIPCLQNKAILVGKSPPQYKDKKIHKICKIIVKILEDMYDASAIENWDGDLNFFNKFKDRLNLYFKMSNL